MLQTVWQERNNYKIAERKGRSKHLLLSRKFVYMGKSTLRPMTQLEKAQTLKMNSRAYLFNTQSLAVIWRTCPAPPCHTRMDAPARAHTDFSDFGFYVYFAHIRLIHTHTHAHTHTRARAHAHTRTHRLNLLGRTSLG
jgi:hypothetical protein